MKGNANRHRLVHNLAGGDAAFSRVVSSGRGRKASSPLTSEAECLGREISRNQGTEFVICGLNGRIQRKDSHGRDDFPPRG